MGIQQNVFRAAAFPDDRDQGQKGNGNYTDKELKGQQGFFHCIKDKRPPPVHGAPQGNAAEHNHRESGAPSPETKRGP